MGIHIYFGVPGSGKSTHSCYIAKKWLRKGYDVFSNFPIRGCYMLNKVDIGKFDLGKCIVILDETSIEYNSRKFKTNFDDDAMYWWRMARHYEAKEIYLYSQSFDDMDLTLRRLAVDYHVVTRSRIPFFHFIKVRLVTREVGVDENDHQFKDLYSYAPFLCTRRIYARRYWNMFDSYEAKYLPPYEKKLWYPPAPTFYSEPCPDDTGNTSQDTK